MFDFNDNHDIKHGCVNCFLFVAMIGCFMCLLLFHFISSFIRYFIRYYLLAHAHFTPNMRKPQRVHDKLDVFDISSCLGEFMQLDERGVRAYYNNTGEQAGA